MRPQLINLQMLKNAKYRIDKTKMLLKHNNNYYTNFSIIIIILMFGYFMYYRYLNKNIYVEERTKKKENFSNQLYSYYNQIQKNEIMEILENIPKNNLYNEFKSTTPNLINMNNKKWVQNQLIY
tara:strand:+ start:560 stop:931 length:372 start_codon:yes stop_codon:yes gene_type:complete